MRVRTFIALVLLLGLAAGIVFLLLPNRAVLELPLDIAGRRIPVWGGLLLAFAIGATISVASQVTGWGRAVYGRARSLWSARHRETSARLLEAGRAAEREGRLEEAIDCYREATSKGIPEMQAVMLLGDALRRAGQLREAISAHEQARRIDPTSDEPGHALAIEYAEAGRLEDARRELVSLIERHPRSAAGAARQLRDLEMRAGDWEAAARAARRLEGFYTRAPMPREDRLQQLAIETRLAQARAESGDRRAAVAALKKIVRRDEGFIEARILLARNLEQLDAVNDARELLVQGFSLTGERALLEALVESDLGRERPEEAISTLRGLAAAEGNRAAARLVLGRLYLRLEMHDEAVDQFEQVLDEAEGHRGATVLLARAEERRGNGARAARLYREVLEQSEPADAWCTSCRAGVLRWEPRCPHCGCFGTVTSAPPGADPAAPRDVAEAEVKR